MRLSAFGATRRFVLEAFFGIKLLFARGERKFLAAISARQYLVCHRELTPLKIQLSKMTDK